MDSEKLQKEHFDKIMTQYEMHYDDYWSQKFRSEFVYEYLFRGRSLAGKSVLEAMCGSGQTTEHLLSMGATVTGLDISTEAISSFRSRWPMCTALCASVLDSKLPDNAFDCVVVMGALHHMHPHVNKTISEIHRVLKPGGYFCFSEPTTGSLSDICRNWWYKCDRKFFAENEAAIDLDNLKKEYSSQFEFISEAYLGNIAYLLVFNSLIFRIPLKLKGMYSPLLLWMERVISPFQGKVFSCYATSQWKKKP